MSHEVLKHGLEINKLQTDKDRDLLSGDYLNEIFSVEGILSRYKGSEESANAIISWLNKRIERNGSLIKHYLDRLKNDIPNFALTKKNEQEIQQIDELADHCNSKFELIIKSNLSPVEKISTIHQELSPIFLQIKTIISGKEDGDMPLDLN